MSTSQHGLWLLQGFLNRAVAERHPQRSLILDLLRTSRQKQAEKDYEEMEKLGMPRKAGEISDEEIAF